MKDIADLLARFFIGFMFFYEAIDAIIFFDSNVETMMAYGLNWKPELFLVGSIFLLVLGAFMVIIGYYANVGALLLLLYWIPFTFIVYSFWNDPIEIRRVQALNFMRNMALCGGLMILVVNGSGRFSVRRLIHVMRLPK